MDRWHIALIEPQSEQIASRALRARGYDAYWPKFPKKTRKRYGVHELRMRPMFPGYMFVNESIRGWDGLRTAPGVRIGQSLLIDPGTGRLAVLPTGEIERIGETEKRLIDQIINPPPRSLPYGVGDTVRVTGGVFSGFYATIETLDDEERIALLMDIFGRKSRVFASHEHLSALPSVS